jgi:3'(2'), 5'-bisphosphate nucleotidase
VSIVDAELAEHLAGEAGAVLLELRDRVDRERTPGLAEDPRALGREGDRLSQEFLADALARHRPADAILSEEAADDPRRLTAERVWIIDPLDGTREYSEGGQRSQDGQRGAGDAGRRDDWAVHVALWTRGAGLTAGAVAIPARHRTFGTSTPLRAEERPRAAEDRRIRLAVSRSHPAPVAAFLASELDVDFVPMGSAGVKAMAVVTGVVDAYVHDGGQYEWDSAAPVAVAEAAGLVAHRLDGSPLRYNQENPWLPDLIVSAPSVAPELESALRRRNLCRRNS